MEQKDLLYVLFWSVVLSAVLYFMGFGKSTLFLFTSALLGIAFAERMQNFVYAASAVFVALAFAAYFAKSPIFIESPFVALLMFLVLPSALLEIRKRIR